MDNSLQEHFERIVRFAEVDPSVLALALTGSRSAGFETPQSDYDCALFTAEGETGIVRSRLGDTQEGIDLRFFTPESFASHAEWGSDTAWDRYAWHISRFPVERTGGELEAAAREKGLVPENEVKEYVDSSLDWYLNQVARSIRCLTRGDETGGRLEAAESVRPFLQAAFAVHGQRLVPYYKYFRWEIEERPLGLFETESGEFVDAVLKLVTSGSLKSQRFVLEAAESVFPSLGYDRRFEEWETGEWRDRYFDKT